MGGTHGAPLGPTRIAGTEHGTFAIEPALGFQKIEKIFGIIFFGINFFFIKNCDVNLFGGEPKDVTVIFTKTEESHIYDLKLNNRSLGEVYIFDGYFGFNSCTTSFDVTRFEISTLKGETKTLIFDDDFTSSSILYSSMGSSDAAWNASGSYKSFCLQKGAKRLCQKSVFHIDKRVFCDIQFLYEIF